MKHILRLYSFVVLSLGYFSVAGQVTIAFQGFEGTASDTWGFTPPLQNNTSPVVQVGAGNYGAAYAVSGTQSMRVGGGGTSCGNGGANCLNGASSGGACTNNLNGDAVEFAPVNISCYSAVSLSVAHRTHVSCSGGPGLDTGEQLYFETRLDGGAWTTVATVTGFSDCTWTYATNPVSCNGNPPVANPFQYTVPAGTQTVAFRVRIQRNRTDEIFYLDNLTLTGTPMALSPISIQHIAP